MNPQAASSVWDGNFDGASSDDGAVDTSGIIVTELDLSTETAQHALARIREAIEALSKGAENE